MADCTITTEGEETTVIYNLSGRDGENVLRDIEQF